MFIKKDHQSIRFQKALNQSQISAQNLQKTNQKNLYKNALFYQYLLYRNKSNKKILEDSNKKTVWISEKTQGIFYGLGDTLFSPYSQNLFKKSVLQGNSVFPYRKSFLCYWLLPFVGFMYTLNNTVVDQSKMLLPTISAQNLTKTTKNWVLFQKDPEMPAFKNETRDQNQLVFSSYSIPFVENKHTKDDTSILIQNYCNFYLDSLENYVTKTMESNQDQLDFRAQTELLLVRKKPTAVCSNKQQFFLKELPNKEFNRSFLLSTPTNFDIKSFKWFWYSLPIPTNENQLLNFKGLKARKERKASLMMISNPNVYLKEPFDHFQLKIAFVNAPLMSHPLSFHSKLTHSITETEHHFSTQSYFMKQYKINNPISSYKRASFLLDNYYQTQLLTENTLFGTLATANPKTSVFFPSSLKSSDSIVTPKPESHLTQQALLTSSLISETKDSKRIYEKLSKKELYQLLFQKLNVSLKKMTLMEKLDYNDVYSKSKLEPSFTNQSTEIEHSTTQKEKNKELNSHNISVMMTHQFLSKFHKLPISIPYNFSKETFVQTELQQFVGTKKKAIKKRKGVFTCSHPMLISSFCKQWVFCEPTAAVGQQGTQQQFEQTAEQKEWTTGQKKEHSTVQSHVKLNFSRIPSKRGNRINQPYYKKEHSNQFIIPNKSLNNRLKKINLYSRNSFQKVSNNDSLYYSYYLNTYSSKLKEWFLGSHITGDRVNTEMTPIAKQKRISKVEKVLRSFLSIKGSKKQKHDLLTKKQTLTKKQVLVNKIRFFQNQMERKLFAKMKFRPLTSVQEGAFLQKETKTGLGVSEIPNLVFCEPLIKKDKSSVVLRSLALERLVNPKLDKKAVLYKLSPRLLVKNRIFIKDPMSLDKLNEIKTKAIYGTVEPETFLTYESRKYNQKKRRKKKLKKETRRRKKRKRFYPRPLWIRYRLLNVISKKRYHESSKETLLYSEKGMNSVNSNKLLRPACRLNQTPSKSHKKSILTLNTASSFFRKNERLVRQSFYTISRNVLGDLNRLLWKSYWLSSNLKPYLKTVKQSLNKIKKADQNWDFYKTLKSLFLYLGRFDNLTSQKGIFFEQMVLQKTALTSLEFGFDKHNISKWQTALYLAEYNRISYQRIQNYISQIRENLTPLGDIKNRSPHLGSSSTQRIARKREADLQKSADFWVKFGKTVISYTEGNYQTSLFAGISSLTPTLEGPPTGIGQVSVDVKTPHLRMYWALSKTNLGFFKDFNKRNQTWTIEKLREQTKHSKTKQMYKTISEKLETLLRNEALLMYPHIWKKAFTDKTLSLPIVSQPNSPDIVENRTEKRTDPNSFLLCLTQKSVKKKRLQELKIKFFGFKPLTNTDTYLRDLKKTFLFASRLRINKSFVPLSLLDKKVCSLPQLFSKKPSMSQVNPSLFLLEKNTRKRNKTNQNIALSNNKSYLNTWSNKLTSKSAYWWDIEKMPFFASFITSFPLISQTSSFSQTVVRIKPAAVGTTNSILKRQGNRKQFLFDMSNNQILWMSTLLFHFCTILSLLSISQIRGVLKFGFLGFSKIYKSANTLFSLISDSLLRLKSVFISYNLFKDETVLLENKPQQFCLYLNKKSTYAPKKDQELCSAWFYSKSHPLFKQQVSLPTFNLFDNKSLTPYVSKTWFFGSKRTAAFCQQKAGRFFSARGTNQKESLGNHCKNQFYITNPIFYSFLPFSLLEKSHLFVVPKTQPFKKENLNSLMLYSLVFINTIFENGHNLYSGTSSLFKQTLETFGRFGPNSLFTFFEKPGELIIDWIAYLFLVEWASDITNTIPENLDIYVGNSTLKVLRTVHNLNVWTLTDLINDSMMFSTKPVPHLAFSFFYPSFKQDFQYGTRWDMIETNIGELTAAVFAAKTPLMRNSSVFAATLENIATTKDSFQKELNYNQGSDKSGVSLMDKDFSLFNIGSTLIQRRLYHLYEILLFQLYQPDTDLITRQKRGVLFWDIWGDFLTQTAEDANINISELTSVKEEQFKLLEKCAEISLSLTPSAQFSKSNLLNTQDSTENNINPIGRYANIAGVGSLQNPLQKSTLGLQKGLDSLTQKTSSISMWNTKESNRKEAQRSFERKLDKKRFSAQQFLSYQGKDTELFIDLHPPKSFNMIRLIHQNESVQQPIGSLVCQIFAGLLSKQISKNILVVGSGSNVGNKGIEKTLLVQAIAGETELKMITDNAYRYAMVYRGVAVGIKLLRDVFDSLALHTPCLFLIEDIHAIGERRPLLISDDDTTKGNSSSAFGSQREEIHEKNQVLYKLSKHQITHYRKPYKGDFSLSIPTNHFCFDLFRGSSTANFGKAELSNTKRLLSPKISSETDKKTGFLQENMGLESFENKAPSNRSMILNQRNNLLSSRLLLKPSELLAPPATSPFSVLTLKEEKKLKPYNVVSEIPWAGLPSEQLAQISKSSYSIRVKVALLADMAISSLTIKLDMITDLLVIMDSVKGNRGFVVFATTHVPYILDPALRRPGRLDETITLGLFPTLLCRWEILKASFGLFQNFNTKGFSEHLGYSKGVSLDFTFSLSSNLLNLENPNSNVHLIQRKLKKWVGEQTAVVVPTAGTNCSWVPPTAVFFQNHYNTPTINSLKSIGFRPEPLSNNSLGLGLSVNKQKQLSNIFSNNVFATMAFNPTKEKGAFSKNTTKKLISQTYFMASVCLHNTNRTNSLISKTYSASSTSRVLLFKTQQAKAPFALSHLKAQVNGVKSIQLVNNKSITFMDNPLNGLYDFSSIYLSFYASPYQLKNKVIQLISGKLGEILFFSKISRLTEFASEFQILSSNSPSLTKHLGFIPKAKRFFYSGVETTYGLSNTWHILSSLIVSFVQKRFMYHQNLIVPKLFEISNYTSLLEPPSPPSSNILLPARRYENYKRNFSYYSGFQNNSPQYTGILEKLQSHQQQRLVKKLYRLPIQESYRSEIITNRMTGFSNASLMIGSLTRNEIQKPSRSNWFMKNRILTRHRNYLTNQWWNGQLPEHNTETTFLSDIDWRYTFVDSIGDLLLDFPDADSHYSSRNRRWFLTKGLQNNWFDFDTTIYSEIYSHLIFDSFVKAFQLYEKNREILDYYAYYSLKNGLYNKSHEFETLKLYQRFQNP